MNNKLNEIRRKISFLRSEMLRAEDTIRKLVDRNEECTVAALEVMAMRTALLVLISERNRLGGRERLLDVDEMLRLGLSR
ncbi:MAG: hypothetical protein J0H42_16475 [Rhizobiales bacterium]|nr:hypothetical protein [Hyphomicrobiales bacterium]